MSVKSTCVLGVKIDEHSNLQARISSYFPMQNVLITDSQCVRRVAQQTSNKNRLTIAKET